MTKSIMEDIATLREGFEPVRWYFIALTEENGKPKVIWQEPDGEAELLDEAELAEKELHARGRLNPSGDKNTWRHYRNMHYSAEYALQMLQDRKIERGIALDLRYRPVVSDGSAITCQSPQTPRP